MRLELVGVETLRMLLPMRPFICSPFCTMDVRVSGSSTSTVIPTTSSREIPLLYSSHSRWIADSKCSAVLACWSFFSSTGASMQMYTTTVLSGRRSMFSAGRTSSLSAKMRICVARFDRTLSSSGDECTLSMFIGTVLMYLPLYIFSLGAM
jgi:hypothetical protein